MTSDMIRAVILAGIFVVWFVPAESSVVYKYLGCFKDLQADRDLKGKEIVFSQLLLASCADQCSKEGFPYLGLQGKRCFCGNSYDKHGTSNKCNETCAGELCGGYLANDVYYSPMIDSTSKAQRQMVAHSTVMTFDAARTQCVMNSGDVALVRSATDLNSSVSVLAQAGVTTGKVWTGVRRLPRDTNVFAWLDPSVLPTYLQTTYQSFWAAGEPLSNPCAVMSLPDGKWTSTACGEQHAFVCQQVPPSAPASDVTTDPPVTTAPAFDYTQLSLYIVLPIFAFCYGGSCVMYCTHKLYKSFKRKKRQKMLLSKLDSIPPGTEYEPDTKPKPGQVRGGRPLSGGKRGQVHPAPIGPRVPPERQIQTPVQIIRIPSPRQQKEEEQKQKSTSQDSTPTSSRPQTSRDVQIAMVEDGKVTAPAAANTHYVDENKARDKSGKSKEEAKKAKLLENALKEARGRRQGERETASRLAGTPVPPPPATPGNDPKPDGKEEATGEAPDDAPKEKKRRKKKYNDAGDSGDSTTNLLSDNEHSRESPPTDLSRDPTNMSIQEILRMKVAANQQSRRPRKKILAA